MKILITGSNGLIGQHLTQFLQEKHHHVDSLTRIESSSSASNTDVPYWQDNLIVLPDISYDAVIHLAGEPIGDARWTDEKKEKIMSSRVVGTRALVNAIKMNPPKVFICASAIGFYGDRKEEMLDETSDKGSDFVSEVASNWESEADKACTFTRVVKIRTGLVLAKHGGALAQMLPFFKMGLGGKVGDAKQYWSWISLNDEVRAIEFLINQPDIQGAVNLVSPTPVTNKNFTRELGRALSRPTFINIPEFMIKMQFGEMAKELLLGSTRVTPKKLIEAGFCFEDKDLILTLKRVVTS